MVAQRCPPETSIADYVRKLLTACDHLVSKPSAPNLSSLSKLEPKAVLQLDDTHEEGTHHETEADRGGAHTRELKEQSERQRKEILRLKLCLLEQERSEPAAFITKPLTESTSKTRGPLIPFQSQGRKRPHEADLQDDQSSDEPSITFADSSLPVVDFDILNRVLRLSRTISISAPEPSEDELVLMEAFGDASVAVMQSCCRALDQIARLSLTSGDEGRLSAQKGTFSPLRVSRGIDGILQWMAKVVLEMDDWVSDTGQELIWRFWGERIRSAIYLELARIHTLLLDVLFPACQNLCGQISSVLPGPTVMSSLTRVLELRDGYISILNTLLIHFEPEVTISLASKVLIKLGTLIFPISPANSHPVESPPPMIGRYIEHGSEHHLQQRRQQRLRLNSLAREETLAYHIYMLECFCDAYCSISTRSPTSKDNMSFKDTNAAQILSARASALDDLRQMAGESLENIWKIEKRNHKQINVHHDQSVSVQDHTRKEKQMDQQCSLGEASKRSLVSILERIWSL
ncbi:hypothetical protein CROQUDRAFT_657356 [Cronartium quercuum f. sp. fusiforme G11]|uniref:Uncharacterized protein n=1 Tax=Cronartium quercuum f. sp. fusiforme G11 TaxID=708437 RepID=A0A9P6NGB4_9BASI|nr:hypothetical protein CROQUDRAFT_657356 [Cronartium quercuum f. sp. fusiforme G11]